ncbi:MAG TPA: hypothetical protein VGG46_13730 [Terriglobales bacterium]
MARVSASPLSVRVKNTTGKTIVGLVFYVALADAAEHWAWFHWNFDPARPLRDFGWNRPIKPNVLKKVAWYGADAELEDSHSSGGALVLSNILFEDGSSWDMPPDESSCRILWHDKHIKGFTRPVVLPPRDQR